MIQDVINGGFELGAGVAVLAHCGKLYEHKTVRGVSLWAVLFFTAWGFWNVYYYPHLGQFWSFVGGIFVMLANCVYVAMLLYYRDGITLRQAWTCLDKWHAGKRPGDKGWTLVDQRVYSAVLRARYAVTDFLGGLVCRVRGHHYNTPAFHSQCLYFCTRCNEELLGRTWADILPLSDEEQEMLEQLDRAYEVRA